MTTSDEGAAAPVAADAKPTPESPPAPDQQGSEAPPPSTEKGKAKSGRMDARRDMRERLRKRDQATEQPREQGKFAPKKDEGPKPEPAAEAAGTEGGEKGSEQPPVAAEAAAESTGTAKEGAGPETSATPKGAAEESFATISLDERNPLFDQGKKELKVPADLERDIRTLANAAVRSRELDTSMEQMQQLQENNMRLQARLEALQTGRPPEDPRIQKMYEELEQSEFYGPEIAEQVKNAFKAMENQRLTEAEGQATQQAQIVRNAQTFMEGVKEVAPQAFPAWQSELERQLNPLLKEYGEMVDWRNEKLKAQGQPEMKPDRDEFMHMARARYLADPRAQQAAQQRHKETLEQERRRIAQEERARLAEEEKQKLEEANSRHSSRPPSPPPSQTHGRVAPPDEQHPVRHGTRKRDIRRRLQERLS